MHKIIQWLSGGDTQYMSVIECMNHDWVWIDITVALCFFILLGYFIIAFHWGICKQHSKKGPATSALADLQWIFILCGICGYGFFLIQLFWPARRLFDIFMIVLAFFTWRYVFKLGRFKVVYDELDKASSLESNIAIRDAWLRSARDELSAAILARTTKEKTAYDQSIKIQSSIATAAGEASNIIKIASVSAEGILDLAAKKAIKLLSDAAIDADKLLTSQKELEYTRSIIKNSGVKHE